MKNSQILVLHFHMQTKLLSKSKHNAFTLKERRPNKFKPGKQAAVTQNFTDVFKLQFEGFPALSLDIIKGKRLVTRDQDSSWVKAI